MAILSQPLSPLGFGAFKIGRNTATKYVGAYDLPDDAAVARLLNGVLDLGITYIDTAPAYGLSEERIGAAIGHRRHELVLSTKVGETFDGGQSRYDFSETAVRRSVEGSLRRLRTDVLDLVFIHSSRDDLNVVTKTDVATTLVSLREAGLIRRIGLSGHTSDGFRATFDWADAVMVDYSASNPALSTVIDEAKALGLPVIVKKGLVSGQLEADEAIPFVLQNPAVDSMVVGSLSLEHMRRNWQTACSARNGARAGAARCPAKAS